LSVLRVKYHFIVMDLLLILKMGIANKP